MTAEPGSSRRRLSSEVLRHASSGPTAGQQQQEERNRNVDLVEERRSDRDLVSGHPLAEHREQRAPQHREGRHQQQHVVEQEARLARNQRLQLVLALQVVSVAYEEETRKSRTPAR